VSFLINRRRGTFSPSLFQ